MTHSQFADPVHQFAVSALPRPRQQNIGTAMATLAAMIGIVILLILATLKTDTATLPRMQTNASEPSICARAVAGLVQTLPKGFGCTDQNAVALIDTE